MPTNVRRRKRHYAAGGRVPAKTDWPTTTEDFPAAATHRFCPSESLALRGAARLADDVLQRQTDDAHNGDHVFLPLASEQAWHYAALTASQAPIRSGPDPPATPRVV